MQNNNVYTSENAPASPATIRVQRTNNTRDYIIMLAGRFLFIVFHIPFSILLLFIFTACGRSTRTDFRQFLTKRVPVLYNNII